ncbi:ABC transporter permease [Nocardia nepalensis]|uniref:ABC transporter permease n=1 Tax=Nocardia nepalensis TaxID=3375448 RepID=UPI003B67F3EA
MIASRGTPGPLVAARLRTRAHRTGAAVVRTLGTAGQWIVFIGQTLWLLPITVLHYRKQTAKVMNGMAWGRGAIIVDGGVVAVLLILGIAIGASVAIEAFAALDLLGFGAMAGIIGGFANVREMGPIVAGIGYAAQVGCRMTAEIGSMRIAEEIDALETMGIRPIPFVVGTRLIGGMICVGPGFLLALVVSFWVSQTVIVTAFGQRAGTYHHYFVQSLSAGDICYSLIKAVVFCAVVTIVHCYYGYFARGGPEGVGSASGRAVRASMVAIITLDFLLTVALWGLQPTFVFKG